jgi:hypothetical protein
MESNSKISWIRAQTKVQQQMWANRKTILMDWNYNGCLNITARWYRKKDYITFHLQSNSINSQREIQLICNRKMCQMSVSVIFHPLQTLNFGELLPQTSINLKGKIWINTFLRKLQKRSKRMLLIRFIILTTISSKNHKLPWFPTSRRVNLASSIRWGLRMALSLSNQKGTTSIKFKRDTNFLGITRTLGTLVCASPLNWGEKILSAAVTLLKEAVKDSRTSALAIIYQILSRAVQ